jgi:hypothetical protein
MGEEGLAMEGSSGLCGIMRDHAGSCGIMRDHVGSCGIMRDHTGSCGIMRDHAGSPTLTSQERRTEGGRRHHPKHRELGPSPAQRGIQHGIGTGWMDGAGSSKGSGQDGWMARDPARDRDRMDGWRGIQHGIGAGWMDGWMALCGTVWCDGVCVVRSGGG